MKRRRRFVSNQGKLAHAELQLKDTSTTQKPRIARSFRGEDVNQMTTILNLLLNATQLVEVIFLSIYTEQKRKVYFWWFNLKSFSVLVESGYMGYEILLTAIFHIGLCNKLQDQSSVKRLTRQWVEFQKVRAGRIFTTKISICFNRRYLYFFPDRKKHKMLNKFVCIGTQ